jgi:hypothetical protein
MPPTTGDMVMVRTTGAISIIPGLWDTPPINPLGVFLTTGTSNPIIQDGNPSLTRTWDGPGTTSKWSTQFVQKISPVLNPVHGITNAQSDGIKIRNLRGHTLRTTNLLGEILPKIGVRPQNSIGENPLIKDGIQISSCLNL